MERKLNWIYLGSHSALNRKMESVYHPMRFECVQFTGWKDHPNNSAIRRTPVRENDTLADQDRKEAMLKKMTVGNCLSVHSGSIVWTSAFIARHSSHVTSTMTCWKCRTWTKK